MKGKGLDGHEAFPEGRRRKEKRQRRRQAGDWKAAAGTEGTGEAALA